jgi:hypothetical protein
MYRIKQAIRKSLFDKSADKLNILYLANNPYIEILFEDLDINLYCISVNEPIKSIGDKTTYLGVITANQPFMIPQNIEIDAILSAGDDELNQANGKMANAKIDLYNVGNYLHNCLQCPHIHYEYSLSLDNGFLGLLKQQQPQYMLYANDFVASKYGIKGEVIDIDVPHKDNIKNPVVCIGVDEKHPQYQQTQQIMQALAQNNIPMQPINLRHLTTQQILDAISSSMIYLHTYSSDSMYSIQAVKCGCYVIGIENSYYISGLMSKDVQQILHTIQQKLQNQITTNVNNTDSKFNELANDFFRRFADENMR